MLLILGLILFIGLVLVHEWGHFKSARRNGVEVEEFGLFFPPRAKVLTKKNGTTYTINWLPLGGFVKLKGENDADRRPGTFGASSFWVKTKILFAGVFMNLLTAYLMLMLLALIGIPKLIDSQFTVASDTNVVRSDAVVGTVADGSIEDSLGLKRGDVVSKVGNQEVENSDGLYAQIEQTDLDNSEGNIAVTVERDGQTVQKQSEVNPGLKLTIIEASSPADEAGIKQGDRLVSIEGQNIYSASQLKVTTKKYQGQKVLLEIQRGSEVIVTSATLRTEAEVQKSLDEGKPVGYLGAGGVSSEYVNYVLQRSTWSAPVVAGGLLAQFTGLTFQGLGTSIASLFRGDTAKASEQVSGPIGVYAIMQQGTLFGFEFILMIIAVISLSLALINALPIPALDGGRWFVIAVSRIFRKPLSKEREELIHGLGFFFLIGLIILISIVDVKRFF